VRPGEIEPSIPIATGLEPASHLDSTWIARHHDEFDVTCANCHTTSNAGGTDDSSFCSNSMCHGSGWEQAGFDAPGLATVMGIYQVEPEPLLEDFEGDPTYQIPQPLFLQQCGGCHGPIPSKGLRVTDYASIITGSDNGPIAIAGSPEASSVLEVLDSGHFAQLTDHQTLLLTQWIADGLPEE
jgi:mono/diheme cytochrome c family protein